MSLIRREEIERQNKLYEEAIKKDMEKKLVIEPIIPIIATEPIIPTATEPIKKITIPKLKCKLLPKNIYTLRLVLPSGIIITVQTSLKEKVLTFIKYTLYINNMEYNCDIFLNGIIINKMDKVSTLINKSLYHISY